MLDFTHAPLLNSARARLASFAAASSGRLASAAPASGQIRFLALRFLQQKVSRRGCVRALSLSVPRRAVGEHEAQLPGSRLSQSISSLAPLAFTSLLATMRESDFCVGIVPSSLPPSGLPLEADPRRPPWVMTLDVPPLPPPLPLRPRMDFGRRVRRHADPAGPACSGVHSRSVLRFASGFFPTRPRGASAGVSRRQGLRAVASSSRLLPPRPAKDFHLQSSAHARHTFVASLLAMKIQMPHGFSRQPVRKIHHSRSRQTAMNSAVKPRLTPTPTSP